jgi:DNA primase
LAYICSYGFSDSGRLQCWVRGPFFPARERAPCGVIPESFKQELLHRVDIVDVIEPHVPLKKGGANLVACCPFHSEKTPSFTVSPAKQFYHCFGCGAHGNAISFLMEYSGLGYVDAVRELAESAGMKMPEYEGRAKQDAGPDLVGIMRRAADYYREQLKTSARAVEYLKGRGLTGQVAAQFGIGYAPAGWQNLQALFPAAPDGKGVSYGDKALKDAGLVIDGEGGRRYDRFRDRIMFPILDQRGAVIAFGGRVLEPPLDDARDPGPKYLNSPETPLFEKGRELYGLSQARQAIRAAGRVVVVEGYMDVVALAQHGVECAVATLGTATTAAHVQRLLRQTDEVVFCFDGDAAGTKAAWHALEVSLPIVGDRKTVRFLFLPPEHDPDSFVRERGREAFEAALAAAQPLSQFFVDGLRQRVGEGGMEGKSRLIHEAKPFLQALAAPVLKQKLLKHLAEASQMDEEKAAELVGIKIAKASPYPGRAAPVRQERAPMQTVEIWLLKRLMVKPALAAQLPTELLRGQTFESLALQVFVAFARDKTDANFDALVIDRFRDTEFEALFKQIKKEVMVMALSPEDVELDFREALPNLELQHVKDRIADMVRDAELRKLTPEEEAQLGRLVERRKQLDLAPNGLPPVL